jgi:hypothetical protein
VIEAKQSTEPLAALDRANSSRLTRRVDEPVAKPLVIALAVVVRDVVMCQNSVELYAARR